MKQSTAWVMAAFGVLALSACGTQKVSVAKTTTNPITGGSGDGGTGDGGTGGNGGGTKSRIPAGPAGALTQNVDFKFSKSDAKLVREIIGGVSSGSGPAAIFGGILGLGEAFNNLEGGTQSCDMGTYTSNATGGDNDDDNIPTSAVVTFNDCKFAFDLNGKSGTIKLNGKLELEDHNPDANDNSFIFVADLQASGTGSLDLGGTVIDLNNTVDLELGLDIMKKSSSYDIEFGVNLSVDSTTLAAHLNASIAPYNMGDFAAGGNISLSGKVGFSQSKSDTVIGFSSNGITYDEGCSSVLNKGSLTITDGLHNLVITQQKCGELSAQVDGSNISL
jgi:hypothetical protein